MFQCRGSLLVRSSKRISSACNKLFQRLGPDPRSPLRTLPRKRALQRGGEWKCGVFSLLSLAPPLSHRRRGWIRAKISSSRHISPSSQQGADSTSSLPFTSSPRTNPRCPHQRTSLRVFSHPSLSPSPFTAPEQSLTSRKPSLSASTSSTLSTPPPPLPPSHEGRAFPPRQARHYSTHLNSSTSPPHQPH